MRKHLPFLLLLLTLILSTARSLDTSVCNLAENLSVNGLINALIVCGDNCASEDLEAAKIIFNALSDLPGSLEIKKASEVSDEDKKRHHLVLIGGPAANSLTRAINYNLPLYFGKQAGEWVVFAPGQIFRGGEYALAEIVESPFNSSLNLIVIAGVTRVGTLHAAKFLVSANNIDKEAFVIKIVNGESKLVKQFNLHFREPAPRQPISVFRRVIACNILKKKPYVPPSKSWVTIYLWYIPHNTSKGWYVIAEAEPDEFPINGFNAFQVWREYTESEYPCCPPHTEIIPMQIFLGKYNQSPNRYVFFTYFDNLHREHGVVYDKIENVYWFYKLNVLLVKNASVSIPWTNNVYKVVVTEINWQNSFASFSIYKSGQLVDCFRLALGDCREIPIDIGPDSKPTIIYICLKKMCFDEECCWVDFFTQYFPGHYLDVIYPETFLNLTDPSHVGDDLNLTEYGFHLIFYMDKLWVALTRLITVPTWISYPEPPSESEYLVITDTDWLTVVKA